MKSAVGDATYWRELFPDFDDEQIALLIAVQKEDNNDNDLDSSGLADSMQSVLSNDIDDATTTEGSIIIGTGENYKQSKDLLTEIQDNLHLFSNRLLDQIKTDLTTLLRKQDNPIFLKNNINAIPELLKTLDCYRPDTLHYLQDVQKHIVPAQQRYYLWQVIKEAKTHYDKANPVSIFESVSTLFRNIERERVSELYRLSNQSTDYESMLNGLIQFSQGTLPGDAQRGTFSPIDTNSNKTFIVFFIGEIIKNENFLIKTDITQKINEASDATALKQFSFWPGYTSPTNPKQITRFIQGMQCLANKGVIEKTMSSDDDYCMLECK